MSKQTYSNRETLLFVHFFWTLGKEFIVLYAFESWINFFQIYVEDSVSDITFIFQYHRS